MMFLKVFFQDKIIESCFRKDIFIKIGVLCIKQVKSMPVSDIS